MSISSTGLYGSDTSVNSDLFNDVEALKEQVTTLSTSYLTTTQEHRDDTSQNRLDISSNLSRINDISDIKIPALESDISSNLSRPRFLVAHVIRSVLCGATPPPKQLLLSAASPPAPSPGFRQMVSPAAPHARSLSGRCFCCWCATKATPSTPKAVSTRRTRIHPDSCVCTGEAFQSTRPVLAEGSSHTQPATSRARTTRPANNSAFPAPPIAAFLAVFFASFVAPTFVFAFFFLAPTEVGALISAMRLKAIWVMKSMHACFRYSAIATKGSVISNSHAAKHPGAAALVASAAASAALPTGASTRGAAAAGQLRAAPAPEQLRQTPGVSLQSQSRHERLLAGTAAAHTASLLTFSRAPDVADS